jgi:hypothetical protein
MTPKIREKQLVKVVEDKNLYCNQLIIIIFYFYQITLRGKTCHIRPGRKRKTTYPRIKNCEKKKNFKLITTLKFGYKIWLPKTGLILKRETI